MTHPLLFSLAALAALAPITVASLRSIKQGMKRSQAPLLLVAFAGALVAVVMPFLTAGSWVGGFSSTLWFSIAASIAVYMLVSMISPEVRKLGPLFFGYLFLLGLLATVWGGAGHDESLKSSGDPWLVLHIIFALATYALSTIAAVAALGTQIQQRALKRKEPTALSRSLPSVSDGDRLLLNLLMAAGVVLGLGVVTGSVLQLAIGAGFLPFDHKTVFSLAALVIIAVLLWVHQSTGLRGRRAAQLVLACYLLLTLAFPGVKFVTDVLLG